ncbi:MAG: periplasmic heavy metal sensor [Deltaproteobacteria bacterium]|jgi:Spy/CpxP family protein refolding chaperone|nr:periplasmic heavy metal sensor [Deltaproteobacteria bacterium]
MSNTAIKKGLIGLTIVAVIGFGAYAFAHMGAGFGHQGWMHPGAGMHHSWYGGPEHEYPGNLSEEEIVALEKERMDFFKATEDLRGDIYSKQLELRGELVKGDADTQKAMKLQKEVSDLEAKMDQKRIGHMIKMRKLNPDAGRGYMGGYHMGYGYSSSDSCWR